MGRDLNKDVHIPLTTAALEFGDVVQRRQSGSFSGERVEISEVYVNADSTEGVMGIAERVKQHMLVEHAELGDAESHVPGGRWGGRTGCREGGGGGRGAPD